MYPPEGSLLVVPTDSIRITLHAFGRAFYLHLQPSHPEILHPEFRIKYRQLSGNMNTSTSRGLDEILKHTAMMYRGDVIREDRLVERLNQDITGGLDENYHTSLSGSEGWARIVLWGT